MKNVTRLYEPGIVEFLVEQGCEALRFRKESVVAFRPVRDGSSYQVSVELYEDANASTPDRRFRARASRRFGLPVSARYGASPAEALGNVQWRTLDSFCLPSPRPNIAGLL